MQRLPDSLPILPIRDNLLLPGGQITQKLFEPRYINMVQDSLAAQDRLVGVCIIDSSKKGRAKDMFYHIGCAGKITSFEEMVDGSFSVVFTGYCRFKLIGEIPTTRQYRRFEVDCSDYAGDLVIDLNPPVDKEQLIKLIKAYAQSHMIDMDWDVLPDTPAFNLIAFFAMHLPFSDIERQQLLEAKTVEQRSTTLCSLIKGHLDNIQAGEN